MRQQGGVVRIARQLLADQIRLHGEETDALAEWSKTFGAKGLAVTKVLNVEQALKEKVKGFSPENMAEVCGIDRQAAREQLGRVATEHHVGFDGLWSVA